MWIWCHLGGKQENKEKIKSGDLVLVNIMSTVVSGPHYRHDILEYLCCSGRHLNDPFSPGQIDATFVYKRHRFSRDSYLFLHIDKSRHRN